MVERFICTQRNYRQEKTTRTNSQQQQSSILNSILSKLAFVTILKQQFYINNPSIVTMGIKQSYLFFVKTTCASNGTYFTHTERRQLASSSISVPPSLVKQLSDPESNWYYTPCHFRKKKSITSLLPREGKNVKHLMISFQWTNLPTNQTKSTNTHPSSYQLTICQPTR